MDRKERKPRGEYFRTKVSGLAVVIMSFLAMAWQSIDSLLNKRSPEVFDLFSILFMLLTSMVGGVILYTAYQKEFLAELGRWIDGFGKTASMARWPLERELLQDTGRQMTSLYPEDTPWILYGLLPGYMIKDRPKGMRKGRFMRAASKESTEIEEHVDGYIRDLLSKEAALSIDGYIEILKIEGKEIAVVLGRNQGIALGLAIAIPKENKWRGGEWVKKQKLLFVRKAFDQFIQRLAALQVEWDKFQLTINDEELGMIVRMLAHEIAGTLSLLVGSDNLKDPEEKALARTTHLVRQLQQVPSLRSGFFAVQPGSIPLLQMVNDVVLGVQEVWKDKKFIVKSSVEEDIEVVGDRNLYSVLQNVVFNALSFSGSKVVIEIEPGVRKDYISINVIDDGPGVPIDKKDWIFEPMVAIGTDYRPRGKGVGLYIARRIAREVSGDVYLGQPEDGKERSNQFVILLLVSNSM